LPLGRTFFIAIWQNHFHSYYRNPKKIYKKRRGQSRNSWNPYPVKSVRAIPEFNAIVRVLRKESPKFTGDCHRLNLVWM